MPLKQKNLVCIICLKRFTVNENDTGNQSNSTIKTSSYTGKALVPGPSDEQLPRDKKRNFVNHDSNDLYKRFLQFVTRYFKLETLTSKFLECAKQVEKDNGKPAILQPFCDNCGQLVSQVCNLYNELQTIQLFLVWKLGNLGDILKGSSKPMTKNSSKKLLSSLAKQINIKADRRLSTFRKSLQLKCLNAAINNGPFVPINKEVIPKEWKCKFTYHATKQALIKLITVFTLSSKQLSSTTTKSSTCATTKASKDANQNQNQVQNIKRPCRRPKRNSGKLAPETPEKSTNQKADGNELSSDAANGNEKTEDNFENDWSQDDGPPSPITPAASDDETPTRFNSKRRHHVVVKAEEDGEQTSSDESDTQTNLQEIKIQKKSTKSKNRKTLKCPKCPKLLVDTRGLAQHLRCAHRTHLEYPCRTCGLRFTRFMDRRAHHNEAHLNLKPGPKPIKSTCSQCSQLFPSRLEMWRHMKQVHQINQQPSTNRMYRRDPQIGWPSKSTQKAEIKCPQCPKLLITPSGLTNHLHKFHHTELEYPCAKCEMVFTRYRARRAHEREVHRYFAPSVPVQTTCSKCPQVFPSRSEMWRHSRIAHKTEYKVHPKKKSERRLKPGPKPIPSDCPKCSETFPSRTELNRHITQMHKKTSEEETPCNNVVVKREIDHHDDNDSKHENENDEADPLEMDNSTQLSKSGKKAELKCPHCTKLLVDGRGLANHLQSNHRTYMEHPCKKCGMRFKKYILLRRHHKKMHPHKKGTPIPSTCSKCSEVFPSRTEMWRHHKKTHKPLNRGGHPISSKCPKCSEVFPSRTELSRHLKIAHKNEARLRTPQKRKRAFNLGAKPKSYDCPKCSEVFSCPVDLYCHRKNTHKLLHSGKSVKSTCSKCSEVLPSKLELFLHMKVAHHLSLYYDKPQRTQRADEKELKGINEQFICEVENCGESFEFASLLRKHLERVHESKENTKRIKCCYCAAPKCLKLQFAYRQTYEMHVRTSHKIRTFGMYKCDVETCTVDSIISVAELNEHLKTHLEKPESGIKEISFCEKCNWGFTKPELRDLHQLCHISPGDDGKMDCPQCSERYGPNVKFLQNHFNSAHGVNLKPFKCDQCKKGFFLQKHLQQHKHQFHNKLNLGPKVTPSCNCKVCGTEFLNKNLLMEHMTRHHPMLSKNLDSRRRDWVCDLCGAQFFKRNLLNTHMIRHETPKFPCDICGALFKFKHRIKDHKEKMHDPNRSKSFICSECGKGFYSDIGLKFHVDSAHKPESEWDLKCPKCPSRFYRKLYLGIHLKTCDGNEEEEKKRYEKEMMESSTVNETQNAGSAQANQNQVQEDISIQFNEQSTEIPPQLPEITSSPVLPQNLQLENQVLLTEQTHDMRKSPVNKTSVEVEDEVKKQLKIEVAKENNDLIGSDDDEQLPEPDNLGNENDSDCSRDGGSPMSVGGASSSDEDSEEDESPAKKSRNLRSHRNIVVKVEVEEGPKEIDDLEKDPLLKSMSPSPPGPEIEKNESKISIGPPDNLKTFSDFCPVVKITRIEKLEEMAKKIPKVVQKARSKIRGPGYFTGKRRKDIECSHCPQKFTFQNTYKLHLRFKHNPNYKPNRKNKTISTKKRDYGGKYKCDFESCEETPFRSIEKLNKHLEKTHVKPGKVEILFCETCNWGFMRKEFKDIHQLVHIQINEKGQISCPQCRCMYVKIGCLQQHFNRVHGINLKFYNCDQCDEGFLFKRSLVVHKTKHKAQTGSPDVKKLKCEECKITFENVALLEKHVKNLHDPGQSFICPEPGCELKFSTRRSFHNHNTLKHIGSEGRKWICELCGAKFTTKETLLKHIENHEAPKWPCEMCGTLFKTREKVKNHIKNVHNPNRQKDWVCSECGKSYFTEMGLRFHFDAAHKPESEWDFKCSKCSRRFSRKLFLDLHLKKCNGEEDQNEEKDKAEKCVDNSSQGVESEKESGKTTTTHGQLQQNEFADLTIQQSPIQCNPSQFSSMPSASQVWTSPIITAPGFQGLPYLGLSELPHFSQQAPSEMQLYPQQYNQLLQFDTGNSQPGEGVEYHSPSSS